MSVDGEAVRVRTATEQMEQTDEPGWEVDPDDDWALAVVATVGRQLKLRREAAGMRAGDFAVVQSYLSTAGKWGRDKLDAPVEVFTTGAWLPPAPMPIEP